MKLVLALNLGIMGCHLRFALPCSLKWINWNKSDKNPIPEAQLDTFLSHNPLKKTSKVLYPKLPQLRWTEQSAGLSWFGYPHSSLKIHSNSPVSHRDPVWGLRAFTIQIFRKADYPTHSACDLKRQKTRLFRDTRQSGNWRVSNFCRTFGWNPRV